MHDANDIMHIASIIAASVHAVHVRAKTHSYSMNITINVRIRVEYSKSYDKHKAINPILSEKDWNICPPSFFLDVSNYTWFTHAYSSR